MTPVVIAGALRDYDWGRIDGLCAWCGVADGGPQAELWYGAHPTAPSPVVGDRGETLRDAWPATDVPLLVKLLAARSPLSLQVHPKGDVAARWLLDPETAELMSDPVEKTELLIALEPFLILAGWRPAADAARVMRAVGAAPEVVAALDADDLPNAVRLLLGDCPVIDDEAGWRAAVTTAGLDVHAVAAAAAVSDRFGADPGVAVAALLESKLLVPGDAVYVPAGVPHAYVTGLGVEVMNSSDNVLRMGLTSKQMSVEHALAALAADRAPVVLRAPDRYDLPGAPFNVVITDGAAAAEAGAYRLVLALTAATTVTVGVASYPLSAGQALAVPAQESVAYVRTSGRAVVVTEVGR